LLHQTQCLEKLKKGLGFVVIFADNKNYFQKERIQSNVKPEQNTTKGHKVREGKLEYGQQNVSNIFAGNPVVSIQVVLIQLEVDSIQTHVT